MLAEEAAPLVGLNATVTFSFRLWWRRAAATPALVNGTLIVNVLALVDFLLSRWALAALTVSRPAPGTLTSSVRTWPLTRWPTIRTLASLPAPLPALGAAPGSTVVVLVVLEFPVVLLLPGRVATVEAPR